MKNQRSERDLSKWSDSQFEFESFEKFLEITEIPTGIYTIHDRGHIIDFHYSNEGSNNLSVFFHGAVPAARLPELKMPIFSGKNIPLGVKTDRMMMSDATMAVHRKLRLGWFSGTTEFDLAARVDEILAKVTALKNFKRLLLIGGSQGGFAALRASHRLPGSIAMIWNPQIRVEHFFWKSHLQGFLKFCFNAESYKKVPAKIRKERRLDLTEVYSKRSGQNGVFLMQNLEDVEHVEDHAKPFAECLGFDPDSLSTGINHIGPSAICALGDWQGGHSLPDRKTVENIACLLLSSDMPTKELMETADFAKHIPGSFTANSKNAPSRPKAPQKSVAEPKSGSVLTSEERNALVSALENAPQKDWYLQYGLSNMLLRAVSSKFQYVSAIDTVGKRVKRYQDIMADAVDVPPQGTLILHADVGAQSPKGLPEEQSAARRWPNFVVKPWKWPPENKRLPDFVLLTGPFQLATSLHLAVRYARVPDQVAPLYYILGMTENVRAQEFLSNYFVIETVVGSLVQMKFRSDIDYDTVLNDCITHIASPN